MECRADSRGKSLNRKGWSSWVSSCKTAGMDQVTATFIAYFGFAAAMGLISNFQKSIAILIASAIVVLTAFLLNVFAGPLLIFALFYAVPYSAGRFSCQLIRRTTQPTRTEIAA